MQYISVDRQRQLTTLDLGGQMVYHSNMHLNELAKLMRTAGDESRLKILCVIFNERKICVSDIAQELNMSVAIVSHHLRVLEDEGILISSRDGKRIVYELPKEPFVADLKKFICKYK
jgi:DNA-binding transcriptional ArsR family regulator